MCDDNWLYLYSYFIIILIIITIIIIMINILVFFLVVSTFVDLNDQPCPCLFFFILFFCMPYALADTCDVVIAVNSRIFLFVEIQFKTRFMLFLYLNILFSCFETSFIIHVLCDYRMIIFFKLTIIFLFKQNYVWSAKLYQEIRE